METAERLITADEYLAREFDDRFTELINGRVVVNQPLIPHQTIVGRIHLALGNWVNAAAGRGYAWLPLDTKIDDYNVLAPDIVWVAQAHLPPRGSKYMVHPPDLVVEVRSPSTWNRDVGVKKSLYERHGVRELWLVDDRSSSVLRYRRTSEDVVGFDEGQEVAAPDTLSSSQLPGLELDLSALFAPAF
ncbi:MAG: Uma2 family endonuclease [Actinomycetota bacterium]|nr:Uma2 family endonuclease [Actinomycetota bacterium]